METSVEAVYNVRQSKEQVPVKVFEQFINFPIYTTFPLDS